MRLGGRGYTANGKLPATVQTSEGTNDQNPTQSPARNLHRLGSRPIHLLPPSMGERRTPHTSDRQHQRRNQQHTRATQTRRRMGKLPQPSRNRRPKMAQRHQRRQHRTRPNTPSGNTSVTLPTQVIRATNPPGKRRHLIGATRNINRFVLIMIRISSVAASRL